VNPADISGKKGEYLKDKTAELTTNSMNKNIRDLYRGTIILPVVLFGCETWALTLREEHRLRVFESRVLRRVFAPKRGEVTGGSRKLYNEELQNFYSSSGIIRMIKPRRMRWA
jgi:hypothetical protein